MTDDRDICEAILVTSSNYNEMIHRRGTLLNCRICPLKECWLKEQRAKEKLE